MKLDLGQDRGSFRVRTEHGEARHSGSIRYEQPRREGQGKWVEEVRQSTMAIADEDTREAIEALDLSEFGEAADQDAMRRVLLEYQDVFRPTTGVVPGAAFVIKLEEGADVSSLNRTAFRKSPMEKELELVEMTKLLDRGILESVV
jgi:hypothetical protein